MSQLIDELKRRSKLLSEQANVEIAKKIPEELTKNPEFTSLEELLPELREKYEALEKTLNAAKDKMEALEAIVTDQEVILENLSDLIVEIEEACE
jgi:hypothetical protein